MHAVQLKSLIARVGLTAHLSAEDRNPPGALFMDEKRELKAQGCASSAVPIRRVPERGSALLLVFHHQAFDAVVGQAVALFVGLAGALFLFYSLNWIDDERAQAFPRVVIIIIGMLAGLVAVRRVTQMPLLASLRSE